MRVLHINSYYNGCPFYRQLYDAQSKIGLDLRVMVPMPRGDKGERANYGPYADVCADHGRYDRAIFHIKHGKILRDARNRYKPGQFGVLHAHSLFSNGYVAMHLAKSWGIPYIVAVRDTDINVFFQRMPHLRALGRRILRGASKVIFLSQPYRDNALKRYLPKAEFDAVCKKSAIIPNGIAPFWHEHRATEPHESAMSAVRLLTVGRASRRKNIGFALDAAELIADEGMMVEYDVVIGVVEDEWLLQEYASYDFVKVYRNLSPEQLLPLYRNADIFVLPSLTETFGLVYAEAMSQGLPVLYTRGQGFDGQFEDGEVGYAIDPTDEFAIADTIKKAKGDLRRLSENCIKHAAKYDWTEFAERYAQIYKEASARA